MTRGNYLFCARIAPRTKELEWGRRQQQHVHVARFQTRKSSIVKLRSFYFAGSFQIFFTCENFKSSEFVSLQRPPALIGCFI